MALGEEDIGRETSRKEVAHSVHCCRKVWVLGRLSGQLASLLCAEQVPQLALVVGLPAWAFMLTLLSSCLVIMAAPAGRVLAMWC